MDYNWDSWDSWLKTATRSDLRLVIQCGEYTDEIYLFLQDLLHRLEQQERYEMCQIVFDEITFRERIYDDFYGFGSEYNFEEE